MKPFSPKKRDHIRFFRIKFWQIVYRYKTNAPYISGDSIAKCCDYYVFGKFGNKKLNIRKLYKANSIFVPGHLLDDFLQSYSHEIRAKTIVSGNSDQNFPSIPILPKSVSLFLCQNLEFTNLTYAHTLPIGIENLRLGRSGRTGYHKLQKDFQIKDKILVPPMSPTNPIRAQVLGEARLKLDLFDIFDDYMNEQKYFSLTRKYRFILALEGNGYENHRIWEALYQGSIPVMLNSNWAKSLSEYNFPILFVDSISELSRELIFETSKRFGNFDPKHLKPLWVPFWSNAIKLGYLP